MDTPQTDNSVADFAGKSVSEILEIILKLAETAMIAAVPLLGSPFLSPIWEGLLNWIWGFVRKAAAQQSAFVVMDIQIAIEEKKDAQAFKDLQAAQATGDQAAIDAARAKADAAAASAIHYNGNANL
jgi:hypothetical protein